MPFLSPSQQFQSTEAKDFNELCFVVLCGLVAEWLGHWTCDQQVASSNPSRPAVECNPGQVVNTRACHQAV